MLIYAFAPSPLGELLLTSDGESLTGLWFREGGRLPQPAGARPGEAPVFRETRRWLEGYFSGSCPDVAPPLAPAGTEFQRRVWDRLRQIPYGETLSYGALAAALGSSPRAVGGAVGRNPISLLIPCHRVVGAGGALTGYAGGLWRKRRLLALERGEGI